MQYVSERDFFATAWCGIVINTMNIRAVQATAKKFDPNKSSRIACPKMRYVMRSLNSPILLFFYTFIFI